MAGFRSADLAKALRVARKEGFDAAEVVVTPSGAIRLLAHRSEPPAPQEHDAEWDEWDKTHGSS